MCVFLLFFVFVAVWVYADGIKVQHHVTVAVRSALPPLAQPGFVPPQDHTPQTGCGCIV